MQALRAARQAVGGLGAGHPWRRSFTASRLSASADQGAGPDPYEDHAETVIEEVPYNKPHHNYVTLVGNLGRDPDYVELASGARLTHLALAVRFPSPVTTWVEVKAWHDLADAAALQLRKRDQIQVVGYLATYTTPAGYSRLQVYAKTIRKIVREPGSQQSADKAREGQ
ncbi:RB38A [Auxenochlorella protothecoides x Auxenochlorella symbiontica]